MYVHQLGDGGEVSFCRTLGGGATTLQRWINNANSIGLMSSFGVPRVGFLIYNTVTIDQNSKTFRNSISIKHVCTAYSASTKRTSRAITVNENRKHFFFFFWEAISEMANWVFRLLNPFHKNYSRLYFVCDRYLRTSWWAYYDYILTVFTAVISFTLEPAPTCVAKLSSIWNT